MHLGITTLHGVHAFRLTSDGAEITDAVCLILMKSGDFRKSRHCILRLSILILKFCQIFRSGRLDSTFRHMAHAEK